MNLTSFLPLYRANPKREWYKLGSGDMQNLFDEAVERIEEFERLTDVLNSILHPKFDGPKRPLFCDLVSYVKRDLAEKDARIAELERICEHGATLEGKLYNECQKVERLEARVKEQESAIECMHQTIQEMGV